MARALAAVLACMAVVACAGEPSSAPGPTSVKSVEASPSEVEPFVDPMPEPPDLTLQPEGDDFEPVIREIFAFRSWLFAHPEMTHLVDSIYHPTCPCNTQLRAELEEQAARRERVFSKPELIDMVLADDRDDSKFFVLERGMKDLVLVTFDGIVLAQRASGPSHRSLWQFTPAVDGSWRAASIRGIADQ